jgi:hypothetical protein
MMTPARAHDRVRSFLNAARRLVATPEGRFGPSSDLCTRLANASGLSDENVRWALENALEWRASDAEVDELVANAGARVARGPLVLIMAGNVTTAALRALACAVARAEEVVVYPSSRDAVLARRLVDDARVDGVRTLSARGDLPLADERAHVVLYGASETARALGPLVRGSLEVHGPGLGLAALTDATTHTSLAALAEDIAAFDQRGCLSPRIAVHVGSPARGRELAEALFHELDELGARRPLGEVDARERQDQALAIQAARAVGDVWESPRGAVIHATLASPTPAPSARMLTVHTVPSWAEAEAWLSPLTPFLSAFGCDDTAARGQVLPELPLRRSPLGRMQRPRFDGPVDRRPHGPLAGDSR